LKNSKMVSENRNPTSEEEWNKHFQSLDTETLLYLQGEHFSHIKMVEETLLSRGLSKSDIEAAKKRNVLSDEEIKAIENSDRPISPEPACWGYLLILLAVTLVLTVIATIIIGGKFGWLYGLATFSIGVLVGVFLAPLIAQKLGVRSYIKRGGL